MTGGHIIIKTQRSSLGIKHADFPVKQVITRKCKQLAFGHFSGSREMTSHTQI